MQKSPQSARKKDVTALGGKRGIHKHLEKKNTTRILLSDSKGKTWGERPMRDGEETKTRTRKLRQNLKRRDPG